MLKVHKIALTPNNTQKTMLAKSAGVARFAYNWALGEWKRMYEEHKENPSAEKPSQLLLRRKLNAIKREEFPWMLEVTKCAPQEAIINLGRAFKNFFDGRAAYPTFKKKGLHDSFKISSGFFSIDSKWIRIPHVGFIRMCEEVRFSGTPKAVTISRRADRWYASITVETSCAIPEGKNSGVIIGVDIGVNDFALDNGHKAVLPKAYRRAEKRLRRAQQSLSRKAKGSENRKKAALKVSKLHAKVSNMRTDFLHKYTSMLVSETAVIAIEDLNVKGMTKNHSLAKSLSDASFGEFRRQLTYKCEWTGTHLVVCDRFFPSSKLCSNCGYKSEAMPLSKRHWSCPECGSQHDRDVNAAVNLRKYAESSPVSACGEFFASDMSGSPDMLSNLCEAGTNHQSCMGRFV